jgi:alcohol dehydrogenase
VAEETELAETMQVVQVSSGVRPRVETLPLDRAGEACAGMMAGDARFRMVLTVR